MRLLRNNNNLIHFLRKYLSNRQFLILSSILVGLTAGLAAVLLKTVTHYIQSFLTHDFHFQYKDYLYLIFPLIGIILTVTYIKYFLKGQFGRGASHILLYISRKSSLLERVTMYSHIVTSALTVGFGGSAGLEAPIVVIGAAIGSNYGRMQMISYKDRTLLLACGTAAGIAAVFDAPIAGVMYVPLTGVFLIAEITGGYELMIPLMIVSAVAYIIVKHFEPYSMDTKELAQKGYLFRGNRDKTILTLLHVEEIIERDFVCVPSNASIMQLTEIIAHSKRNIFPVIDKEGNLLGIIVLENIREILFELEIYKDLPAIELMVKPPAVIEVEEEMNVVMRIFDDTGAWNLPVVKDNKYIGFVSKSSIFSKYRDQMLSSYTEE